LLFVCFTQENNWTDRERVLLVAYLYLFSDVLEADMDKKGVVALFSSKLQFFCFVALNSSLTKAFAASLSLFHTFWPAYPLL